jgi:hypothetical protein
MFALTSLITMKKIAASRFLIAVSAAFPVFLVFLGIRESYGTMMKFFLFLFPHVFLFAGQDMAGGEVAGGALENVLFLRGRFKDYLWQKNFVLAGAAAGYSLALFFLLAVWGLASGRFDPASALQLGPGLLAGIYYIAVGGALSYLFRAGSNVIVVLLAQAGAVVALLLSAAARTTFLDCLESGRFPDLAARLKFAGLVSLFPNLIASRRLLAGASVVAGGAMLAFVCQRARLRRLELSR